MGYMVVRAIVSAYIQGCIETLRLIEKKKKIHHFFFPHLKFGKLSPPKKKKNTFFDIKLQKKKYIFHQFLRDSIYI